MIGSSKSESNSTRFLRAMNNNAHQGVAISYDNALPIKSTVDCSIDSICYTIYDCSCVWTFRRKRARCVRAIANRPHLWHGQTMRFLWNVQMQLQLTVHLRLNIPSEAYMVCQVLHRPCYSFATPHRLGRNGIPSLRTLMNH